MFYRDLLFKCLNTNYTHTHEGADYAIEVKKNTLYLLFEWSDGLEDWISNFNFPIKSYKHSDAKWYCHRGFLKVWKGMRDEIENTVAALMKEHDISNIICVGFSHGAAMSVLATEDMAYLYGDKCKVSGYGFGTPRVLWGRIPEVVKQRLENFTSIRNIPDIVTHVPPMFLGFRNAGKLIKIGKKGTYGPVKAHYPGNYITELTEYEGLNNAK